MAGVIEFKPSRKLQAAAGATKPRRKRKPREELSSDHDPRLKVTNRTFEVTQVYVSAENIIEKRLRIRIDKGAVEDQAYEVGGVQCYCGLVSEELGRGKWSPYTWGHVPVNLTAFVREIVSEEPAAKLTKKDDKHDAQKE